MNDSSRETIRGDSGAGGSRIGTVQVLFSKWAGAPFEWRCATLTGLAIRTTRDERMGTAVRVRLQPVLNERGGNAMLARGAELLLEQRGTAPSELKGKASLPAKITLFIASAEKIRNAVPGELRPIAVIEGNLVREQAGPRFVVTTTEISGSAGSEPEPSEQRFLRFTLADSQFRAAPELARKLSVVPIMVVASRMRYLSLTARIEVAGAIESESTMNGVVDIYVTPVNPPGVLRVCLTDDEDQVLPGAKCKILSGATSIDEAMAELVADGDGIVELLPSAGADQCELQWSPADDPSKIFVRSIFLEMANQDEGLARRLRNLGFSAGPALEDDVGAFEHRLGRAITGQLSSIANELVAWHDRGEVPAPGRATEISSVALVSHGPSDAEDLSDPFDQTAVA